MSMSSSFKENRKKIQAMEEIQILESYITDLWQFLPMPVCYINPLNIISDVGAIFEQFSGCKSTEIIGENLEKLFANPRETKEIEKEILEKGRISNRKTIFLTKEKREIPVLLSAMARRDEEGDVIGYFLSITDLTAIEQVKDEIKKEKKFSENIIATVPDSLLVLDTNLRVKSANQSFYEKFQTEPEKVMGRNIADILHDKEGKLSTALTGLFGTDEMLENFELHYQSEKGERIFNITARGIVVAEEEEEEEEELVVLEDITERKRAEEKLRESEEEYRSLVESTEDSVYLVNRDCRYIFLNDKHLSRLGLPLEEIIGKTYGEFHNEEETKEFAETVEEVLKTGRSVQHEHRSRKDDRCILRTLSPIKNTEGITTMVTVVSKDISDRKRAEQRQLQHLKELEDANRELKDFAHIVSHDLKAPLRSISSLAEWLSTDYSDKLDEKGKEQLDLLTNRVRRMHNLIDGILQYSRVGRLKEEKKEVDFNTLVSEVIDMINPPENIGIEVVNELPTIVCEKTRMEQVFQNLLSNAVRYMDKPKGKITIGCTEEDGYWKFSVADNGPGIEEKYYEKIFQIFQTLKPSDEVESTGMGLIIVGKIVETQGGKIWVDSKVGEGSTFFFTVPKESNKGGDIL